MGSDAPQRISPFPYESLASEPEALGPPAGVRAALFAFAASLAIGGLWLTASALLSPAAIALPLDRASAAAAATRHDSALWAARLGAIRGDLFAQAAYAEGGELAKLSRPGAQDQAAAGRILRARADIETGLALAPVNGAAWLYLSALPPVGKAPAADPATAVQMSYFTAPNDPTLARARLERVLSLQAPVDKDIQEFMKGDIRLIVTHQPESKASLTAAYKAATSPNRAIFQAAAAEVDPEFGKSLDGEAPK